MRPCTFSTPPYLWSKRRLPSTFSRHPNMLARLVVALLAAFLFAACDDGHLRGSVSNSPDGKTYLAVVDDNGGHCGPIKVDGEVWKHPLGEAAPISSGTHTIECGAGLAFDIPSGVVFKFKYWGP